MLRHNERCLYFCRRYLRVLHAIYHRPNGWDHMPPDQQVPCGESCMWGDYHVREAALLAQRMITDGPPLTFYGPEDS